MQEPGQAQGGLLNELIRLSGVASAGGAIFAWTSTSGVEAFLEHDAVTDLLDRGSFRLVVGTDTITTPKTVAALLDIAHRRPTLELRAFVHDTESLFHPKFAWFEVGDDLVLVVGSGNLTRSGLLVNWEIFTVLTLEGAARTAVELQIAEWFAAHQDELLDLTDPRVAGKVDGNRADERALLRSRRPAPTPPHAVDLATGILVAEPTYAAGRVSQANFHQAVFEGFFGAGRDVDSWHVFHTVSPTGDIVRSDSIKAITSQSRNFRFELGAPPDGPGSVEGGYPIAVFLRLSTGEFLYHLLVPGSDGFDAMDALLTDRDGPRKAQRRQVRTDVDAVRQYWPDAPILTAPVPAD